MSSFWLILKLQWTIEEISIFSNSSHLEWRAGLSDTILKRTHPRTISARFGLIWFRGFRGEDLNVKVYDVRRMPSDGKSSHGLWPGELKKHIVLTKIIWPANIHWKSEKSLKTLRLKKRAKIISGNLIQLLCNIVKPVNKGDSREPENVPFIKIICTTH